MLSKSILVAVAPFMLASTLVACSKPEALEEPIRSVKVMTVGMQTMHAQLEYAAEVKARIESRLSFRVGGKLIARPVEVGQRVMPGQLLGQIDSQDFKLANDAARAQWSGALTNRDLAASDYKRYLGLKEQNFISGAELERRETQLKSAQAQLDQAQAQLAAQGNQSGYASLHADVRGVVTGVFVEQGQVIAAGTPVLQLAQDGPRDVVFAVPEDKVNDLKPGTQVSVQVWSTRSVRKGVVREVAASADPVTRTFTVKAALNGQDELALGSTVSVLAGNLQPVGVQAIKLPTSALRQEGQNTAVWVLDPATMTVKSQTIKIATADGNDMVIAAGLLPGAQVVVAGVHVLAAGQKVSIYKEKTPVALTSKAQTAINSEVTIDAASKPAAAAAPVVSK
jgi:RND family efflux transporter MFP subunit